MEKNKIKTKRERERERERVSFFEYFSLAPATGPTSSDLKDLGIVVIFLRPPANSFRRLVSVTRSEARIRLRQAGIESPPCNKRRRNDRLWRLPLFLGYRIFFVAPPFCLVPRTTFSLDRDPSVRIAFREDIPPSPVGLRFSRKS